MIQTDNGMQLQGADFTKHSEGYRDTAYKDTNGYPTVGYGFNLGAPDTRQALIDNGVDPHAVANGQPIDRAKSEQIFNQLYGKAQQQVSSALDSKYGKGTFSQLPADAQDVLSDMSYNIGAGVGNWDATMKLFANHQFAAAGQHLAQTPWAKQTGSRSRAIIHTLTALGNQ